VTAEQLAHLAEQASFAAGYYAATDPSTARHFAQTAERAGQLSSKLASEEEMARLKQAWQSSFTASTLGVGPAARDAGGRLRLPRGLLEREGAPGTWS
jgi:hypothetical protein